MELPIHSLHFSISWRSTYRAWSAIHSPQGLVALQIRELIMVLSREHVEAFIVSCIAGDHEIAVAWMQVVVQGELRSDV
jgi:hypothetical protein